MGRKNMQKHEQRSMMIPGNVLSLLLAMPIVRKSRSRIAEEQSKLENPSHRRNGAAEFLCTYMHKYTI